MLIPAFSAFLQTQAAYSLIPIIRRATLPKPTVAVLLAVRWRASAFKAATIPVQSVRQGAASGCGLRPSSATSISRGSQRKEFLFKRLRSEEHTSELQSPCNLVCRLLL